MPQHRRFAAQRESANTPLLRWMSLPARSAHVRQRNSPRRRSSYHHRDPSLDLRLSHRRQLRPLRQRLPSRQWSRAIPRSSRHRGRGQRRRRRRSRSLPRLVRAATSTPRPRTLPLPRDLRVPPRRRRRPHQPRARQGLLRRLRRSHPRPRGRRVRYRNSTAFEG